MSRTTTRSPKGPADRAADAHNLKQAAAIADRLVNVLLENPQLLRRILSTSTAEEDDFVDLEVAMAMSGLKKTMIYQLIRQNKFPQPVKPGGVATRFSLVELRQWQQDAKDNRDCR